MQKGFAKKEKGKALNLYFFISVLVSSITVVFVNTSMYIILMLCLYTWGDGFTLAKANVAFYGEDAYANGFLMLILGFVGINFFIELGLSVLTSSAVANLIKALTRNYNLGFKDYFNEINSNEDYIEEDNASEEVSQ